MAAELTWAQQAFNRLVREHRAPMLKRHGYKKAGLQMGGQQAGGGMAFIGPNSAMMPGPTRRGGCASKRQFLRGE
jgi:hypothetical protein